MNIFTIDLDTLLIGGGGWRVQACYFEKNDLALGVNHEANIFGGLNEKSAYIIIRGIYSCNP